MNPALLTDTIDIYRATQGAGVKTSYGTAPYDSGVPCLIQPVTGEFSSKTDMNYGRQYDCYLVYGQDISLSDRVVDQNGKTYQVTGSYSRGYGMNVQHIVAILTEEATEGPDL